MKNVPTILVVGVLVIASLGCAKKKEETAMQPPTSGTYAAEPTSPDEALTTQLREGTVQMAAASDSLQSALKEANRVVGSLSGDHKEAAKDVADFLDDAGESVAEASAEPPTEEDIKKDFASADDLRKHYIELGNDAYRSLEQSLGTLQGLEDSVEGLTTLADLITLSMDDLGDAIEALGGTIESEQEDALPEKDTKG